MSKCLECRFDIGHDDTCPLVAPEVIERLQGEVLALTVERDNLQKMSTDWQQKAQHNYDVAEQYRKDFERACSERDRLAALIEDMRRRWPLVIAELERPIPMCSDPEGRPT